MRNIKTKSENLHEYIKKSSDYIKKSYENDKKAEIEFWKLCIELCKKYNINIVAKTQFLDLDNEELNYIFPCKRDYIHSTEFNENCEGEFIMTFYGELSSEEIEEIKEITNCQKVEKIIEETDFKPHIFYKFQFNFKKYWNINYQH